MGNSRVIPHKNARLSQPARQFEKIVDVNRPVQPLFGTAKPMNWHCLRQLLRHGFKYLHRSTLGETAGERMNYREASQRIRASNNGKTGRLNTSRLNGLAVVEIHGMHVA